MHLEVLQLYTVQVLDRVWKTSGGSVHLGCIVEENRSRKNVYRVCTTDGLYFPQARILSPDADKRGFGEYSKPRNGSHCVIVTTNDGAQPFIVGFHAPDIFDEDADVEPVADQPQTNQVAGDKTYSTEGGARFMMKRGGMVILEGGLGASLALNPVTNRATLRSSNMLLAADGLRIASGRKNVEADSPDTLHVSDYQDQVGTSYDRVRIRHGKVASSTRREVTVSGVTFIGGREQEEVRYRETINSSGEWVGEGPKYSFADGASERAPLGDLLMDAIAQIIQAIATLQVSTPFGATSPPISSDAIRLSTELLPRVKAGELLSDYIFFAKSSTL